MRERAKSGARTKKKREGGGEKHRKRWKRRDYRQPIVKKSARAVGGLSILIGQFWLFRQQVSRHDGISSFSIVMTACSFENVLKLKPQQYSACSISKVFRRKSWDFLQSIRNRLIRFATIFSNYWRRTISVCQSLVVLDEVHVVFVETW